MLRYYEYFLRIKPAQFARLLLPIRWYLLLPRGTVARSAMDWKNYNKVKAYLHLKD
ncbi:hypothetical protein SIO70_09930 [Chitinophaga sancti]|uniref:hypothetical protein n=1 Tax=Chitinophaga sancti TaxID=1004 RepID=UPI002A75B29E|nr:hypothetical protein [Chitinophaga sancti]WPQ65162.1 hypothetical protein SIO70_09930 [Chitinophaga sancti]